MNVTWYGNRCVRIEVKDASVLVDPFDPKETGLRGPVIKDDLVLLSAYTQPASVMERINDEALVIRGPGEYEKKGIAVRGIAAYQDTQQGKELGLCTLFTIHAEELAVCHLGALGQDQLTNEQVEAIGDPDILLIPVGGQSALDPKAAAELVTRIEPKIVVPIQFTLPNASYDAQPVEKFMKELGLPAEKMDVLRINKKQLPTDQTKLIILQS